MAEYKTLSERLEDCRVREREIYYEELDKVVKETGRADERMAEARTQRRMSREW